MGAGLLVTSIVGAGAARGQGWRPPLPPPPVGQELVCALNLDALLGEGLHGAGTLDDRSAASELVEALYQRERDRLTQQVTDELGALAFAVFVPGEKSAGEERLDELLAESCLHQALLRARQNADAEVKARAQQDWDHFYPTSELPGELFQPDEPGEAPPRKKEESARAPLRLELPPAGLVVPGAVLTGRVVDETTEHRGVATRVAADDATDRAAGIVLSGLVVEAAGQTVRVGRDGRFVFRAPEQAGEYAVEVRDQAKAFLLPIEDVFTIEGRGVVDAAPKDALVAPRVVLPDERLVIRGNVPGGGAGLATRAYVGGREAPLLAMTPIAAIFDVSDVPAGPHALTLYQGGQLVAAAPIDRVTLVARSDRSTLHRGETATFTVDVDGLPVAPAPAGPARGQRGDASPPLAFLDWENTTPEVGRFRDHPDRFSLPIERDDLTSTPSPTRGEGQRAVLARVEALAGVSSVRPAATAVRPASSLDAPATAPGFTWSYDDAQRYRGVGAGDFRVRITVRLPEEAVRNGPVFVPSAPAFNAGAAGPVVAAPAGAGPRRTTSGTDDLGAYVEIDGQRLYTAIGPPSRGISPTPTPMPAGRLFEAPCSGTCLCHVQSWSHAEEVGDQIKAKDQLNPGWRALTAKAHGCVCEEVRSACYSLLSDDCRTRCKAYFESALTDRVSGFAVDTNVGACQDLGPCNR